MNEKKNLVPHNTVEFPEQGREDEQPLEKASVEKFATDLTVTVNTKNVFIEMPKHKNVVRQDIDLFMWPYILSSFVMFVIGLLLFII